jgi:hypothetical protein
MRKRKHIVKQWCRYIACGRWRRVRHYKPTCLDCVQHSRRRTTEYVEPDVEWDERVLALADRRERGVDLWAPRLPPRTRSRRRAAVDTRLRDGE